VGRVKNYQLVLCENDYRKKKILLGDLNNNGRVDEEDSERLYEYIFGAFKDKDPMKEIPYADMNQDGVITEDDLWIVYDISLGLADPSLYWKEIDEYEIFEREVCEIGSSTSSFSGKAFNTVFYTKIDGTHELSFELPRYYLNEETGETVSNELIEFVTNKNKLILKDVEENKEYHFVVNKKIDKEDNGIFSYSYSCTDAYIEELSKTGYGLTFTDEVDGNGLGTIHELAREVLKDSGWEYAEEKTGDLLEYSTDIQYNKEQRRYDTVYIPQPVHPIEYVEEVGRYCNKLDVYRKVEDELRPIYCYEDTEQIVPSSVRNLLYNSDEFIDLTGWTSFKKSDGVTKAGVAISTKRVDQDENDLVPAEYYLELTATEEATESFLMNDTAADANKHISANQPYLFKYEVDDTINKGYISSIRIFNKNPLTGEIENIKTEADYSQVKKMEPGKYYTIKTNVSFLKPYIVFGVQCNDGRLVIKNFSLFEVKGKALEDKTAEEINLELISELPDKKVLNPANSDDQEILTKLYLPMESTVSAYTHKKTMYFYCNKDKDKTVTYLDFEEQVNVKYSIEKVLLGDIDQDGVVTNSDADNLSFYVNNGNSSADPNLDFTYADINQDGKIDQDDARLALRLASGIEVPIYIEVGEKGVVNEDGSDFTPLKIKIVDELPLEPKLDTIYKLSKDGKFYQYYQVKRDGVIGGAWDLALYGDGVSNKRRTLIAQKSNRFNLLQKLAELFKVWCVFEIERDSTTGTYRKIVWFKEKAINENFSGFHKGVNLQGLERIAESEEIVTKMFVEDIENEFSDNGFVTIRSASMNPWGENYYYNFKYYVDQHLLNGEMVESDLQNLYSKVKGKNAAIFDLNDKITYAAVELNNLSSMLKSISYCLASCAERITSINVDLKNSQLSKTDRKMLKTSKKSHTAQQKKYQNQKDKVKAEYDALKKDYDDWNKEVERLQKEKEELIHNFEIKYAQYIKEGVWSDSSYIDNDAYYLDSQKVSNTSAMPKTSWNISVIDGSVIEELEDFKVSVGDQTILVDNEFFGIVPKVEENYVFEVLITGIKEYLDNKTKNEIEVRNYLTSFEDIFQRISAATQTLELNEQTYDKAAYFKSDGTVDKDIIQSTLLQNALTLANSSDNSYILDENGLALQSLINPAKKMRAIADGLFFSNSMDLNGEPIWKTGITAEGINASVITSGQLNTSLIKIYSDGQVNFSWGPEGITSYDPNSVEDSDSFIRLDGFGLYSIRNVEQGSEGFQLLDNGKPWFTGLTRNAALDRIIQKSVFSITDKGFRLNVGKNKGYIRLGYENGSTTDAYGLYITDDEGNMTVKLQNNGDNIIAGWKVTKGSLQYRENDTLKMLLSGVASQNATYVVGDSGEKSDWLIWAGPSRSKGRFGVRKDGTFYASEAHITGSLTVAKGSKIAGWDINESSISSHATIDNAKKRIYLASADSTANFWIRADDEEDKRSFSVSKNGYLYARNAEIEGKITASEGDFSDKVTIGGTSVTAEKLRKLFSSATGGGKGDTYITNIYAGGGSVGGWNIGGQTLTSSAAGSGVITLDSTNLQVEVKNVGMSSTYKVALATNGNNPGLKFTHNTKDAYLYARHDGEKWNLYFDDLTLTNKIGSYTDI
jgi:hypothetical protein